MHVLQVILVVACGWLVKDTHSCMPGLAEFLKICEIERNSNNKATQEEGDTLEFIELCTQPQTFGGASLDGYCIVIFSNEGLNASVATVVSSWDLTNTSMSSTGYFVLGGPDHENQTCCTEGYLNTMETNWIPGLTNGTKDAPESNLIVALYEGNCNWTDYDEITDRDVLQSRLIDAVPLTKDPYLSLFNDEWTDPSDFNAYNGDKSFQRCGAIADGCLEQLVKTNPNNCIDKKDPSTPGTGCPV